MGPLFLHISVKPWCCLLHTYLVRETSLTLNMITVVCCRGTEWYRCSAGGLWVQIGCRGPAYSALTYRLRRSLGGFRAHTLKYSGGSFDMFAVQVQPVRPAQVFFTCILNCLCLASCVCSLQCRPPLAVRHSACGLCVQGLAECTRWGQCCPWQPVEGHALLPRSRPCVPWSQVAVVHCCVRVRGVLRGTSDGATYGIPPERH